MSVARRAMIGFVAITVIALSAVVFVYVQASQARDALESYRTSTHRLEMGIEGVRTSFYAFDDQMNMYVAVLAGGTGTDQGKLAEETFQQAVDARLALDGRLHDMGTLTKDPRLTALLTRITKDTTAYEEFADQTRTAGMNGDAAKAVHLSTIDNLQPSNDIMPALDDAAAIVKAAVDAEQTQLVTQQQEVQRFIVVGAGALLAVILALAIGMHRWVVRPVSRLRDVIGGIASGERARSERVPVRSKDEFGQLAACFNQMLDTLATQDRELRDATVHREQQMQASFEQQRIAEKAVRSRAQRVVDETAEAVRADLHELMSSVQVVRAAADTIDAKVGSADVVTRGVVDNARRADEVVSALETSLRRVAGMTELIAGVADQTKLLALNATIEAARAGTAGRGFSVVADEVKQLATTTAKSTKEIVTTIASLERDAEAMTSAIGAMSAALGGVDDATGALKEVAAEQHALVQRLDAKVSETIGRIDSMATIAERLERRAHPRMQVSGELRLRGPNGVVQAEFGDLSEGGLLCRCPRPVSIKPGTLVDVDFTLDGQRFSQRCQVIAADGTTDTQVRVRFVNASPALVSAVRRLQNPFEDDATRALLASAGT